MTAPGLHVDPERLRQHAGTVGDVRGRVAEAADAGAHVAALDDAYGWLCQALGLPEMLRGPQERVTAMIRRASEQLEQDRQKLGDAAAKYDEAEAQALAVLRKLAEELARAAATIPRPGGN
ncbi:type VII secretion target [Prauserella muralis]|uniref:Uncharacterized protein n=1 Tax=Prauserella muralis TaxID=588067 RepID=A0A2V4B8X2_9PSEU|nr:type VII secretion target [Prauserella muralis]PXY31814.1 hypothetical protein BAY60_05620 [Prauserella muralis]TWE13778.1 excreted virulence factor EspC (type VII ESX diderm) [Prauserella muralis]